jgi:cytochrome c oxidase cbb3-type subunit III
MSLKQAALWLALSAPIWAQTDGGHDAGLQLYRAHCQPCHGENGDQVTGVSFRAGIRRATTDEEVSRIIVGGIPGTGMPPTNLPEDQRRVLVGYLRSMHASASGSGASGDAARGMAIFEGKGGCAGCHRAGDRGSHFGPDLSDIGSNRQAAYLEKSIVDPHDMIAPQNRMVKIVTKQGATISGRRLNEDTYSIQLIDAQERLISVSKSDVREYTLLTTTPMPSYQGKLSQQEVADVVSFLLSQKGAQ